MDSKEYWREREEENLRENLKTEEEYIKTINSYYDYMMDQIQKEIDGFYAKYAKKEGITLAEAKKRVSELDIEAYERKAEKYVREKNFSQTANEEMRLYNATMKINRLELLKANIGLELVDGFDGLQKYYDQILTERTLSEFERQAGILGKSVQNNAQAAHAIVNGSFKNARFSDRIWMYQDMLKGELTKLLLEGMIQGRNSKQLAKHLTKVFGVSKSNAERLMRTELARVQTEAQKQSFERNGYEEYQFHALGNACGVCRALDGKHFKVKDMMPGENARPMHPNCRCSVSAYEDDDDYEKWLDFLSKGGTTEEWERLKKNSAGMSATNTAIRWPERKNSISKEQYRELTSYARNSSIVLEGFKRFDGDIDVIKEMIDGANEIADKFPAIRSGRKKLTISLDEHMNSDDFAITNGHIIRINADAFRDAEVLRAEYEKLEKERWFVKGTDYRSIIKHEVGHVVANMYGLDGMEIASGITNSDRKETMNYIAKNLSEYAGAFKDGSEIISEVFSAVFGSDNPSEFSLKFMEECVRIKEKGM